MSLGENIKNARNSKKLSQKELAEALSTEKETIGNTTISNWENNINKPDADLIASLCKVLDVDANYLLDFNKENVQETNILEQYKILFDKDKNLTDEQKKFFIDFLEEKHKEIDKNMNKE